MHKEISLNHNPLELYIISENYSYLYTDVFSRPLVIGNTKAYVKVDLRLHC